MSLGNNENNTNIIDTEDVKLINSFKDLIAFIIFILFIGYTICFYGYGATVRYIVGKRCNVETVANLVEDRRGVYQYVPYGGGRVQNKNEYFLTYQFNINDTTYNIYKHSYSPYYPEYIDVRYNPNDLTEYLYNDNGFVHGNDDVWVWVKDKQYEESTIDFNEMD